MTGLGEGDGLHVCTGVVPFRLEPFTASLRLQSVVVVLVFDTDYPHVQEQCLGILVIDDWSLANSVNSSN